MSRLRLLTFAALLTTSLLLAGPPTQAASREQSAPGADDSAEGFWVARTPEGVNVKWAVLDGGETWGIYEAQGVILGAFHGRLHAAGGALHGNGLAFDIPSGSVGATTYTGSYIPRQTLSLTTAFGLTVNAGYVPGYEQPARLSDLQGRYAGEGLNSRSPVIAMQLSVAPDGRFVMTSGQNCAASGTATPRPGGRNVFDVHFYFAGSGCALGDGTRATGIAHVNPANGELFVLAMNEVKTDGWLYLGRRD